MRTHFLLFLAAVAMLFVSCEKDSAVTVTTETSTIAGALADARISAFGQLTDQTGAPVANALVVAGDKSTTTNDDGLWRIDNANVNVTFGYITFSSPDHIQGSRTVYASDGATYEVDVQLLTRNQSYSVSAATGGTVTVGNSTATIEFGPSAFAKTDGTPIASGNITVSAHYLDPSLPETFVQMPGDLRARAADATSATDFTLLTTFGMMAVELRDANGSEVQLADGQTATLTMPLPTAAQAAAPATIPLWYFDDVEGIWIEEGQATRVGNTYVGQVSHFTFWNCDIPTEYVTLCGQIVFDTDSGDSTRQTNVTVVIQSTNWGNGYGYTDENGHFCGIVPANEPLTLKVLGNGGCGNVVFVLPLGSLTDDTDLGVINISDDIPSLVTLSGTASCNGDPVIRGVAKIYQNGNQVAGVNLEPDGSFSTDFIVCDTTPITVIVVDYNSRTTSDPFITPYAQTIATGDVPSCLQVLNNSFEILVNGVSVVEGDSCTWRSDGPTYFTDGLTLVQNSFFGYSLIAESGLPEPLTTGVYTLSFPNSILTVTAPSLPSQGRQILSDFNLTITQVATPASPYTVGQIGPFTETVADSLGMVTNYEIQINFSAYSF